VRGTCAVLGLAGAVGIGVQRPRARSPFPPNPCALRHGGSGGSTAFADPDKGVAMASTPNRAAPAAWNDREAAAIAAVYGALG
jgi:CubicO group peptidase (beta-lactamase class C family)